MPLHVLFHVLLYHEEMEFHAPFLSPSPFLYHQKLQFLLKLYGGEKPQTLNKYMICLPWKPFLNKTNHKYIYIH